MPCLLGSSEPQAHSLALSHRHFPLPLVTLLEPPALDQGTGTPHAPWRNACQRISMWGYQLGQEGNTVWNAPSKHCPFTSNGLSSGKSDESSNTACKLQSEALSAEPMVSGEVDLTLGTQKCQVPFISKCPLPRHPHGQPLVWPLLPGGAGKALCPQCLGRPSRPSLRAPGPLKDSSPCQWVGLPRLPGLGMRARAPPTLLAPV